MKYTSVTELLSSPDRFTTHAFARDDYRNEVVGALNHRATSWCLLGAVEAVYGAAKALEVIATMKAALPLPYSSMWDGIEKFNDQNSYEDVYNFVSHLGV